MRTLIPVACVLFAAALLTACGTTDDQEQARATVERFYDAVRRDDAGAACNELGENTVKELESQTGQSCEGVVTRLDYAGGAIVSTQVYVTSAIVDLRNGESAYLDREPSGWKLSAVGCKPEEGRPKHRPLDCEVEA